MSHFNRSLKRVYLRFLANIRDSVNRFRATEHTFMVVAAIIIGFLGGFGGVGIQKLILFFKELLWGQADFSIEYLASLPLYIRIGVPVLGSVVVGLIIQFYAREAKGHGVPEVMEAIALQNGVIRPRVVIAKLFSSAFYIGAGGSVGREGPVIQIGSAIGSAIGQFIRVNPQRMKTFVACGAASGIAAAFNAPIAGALFAVEIILGDFAVAQFSPIVISSVMATVVSRHFMGDHLAFSIPTYHLLSPWELIPYAFLGLLAGLVALLFIKSLYGMEDFFDKWKTNDVVKTLIGGLGIGITALYIPYILGVGYETMDQALEGELTWKFMFILIFFKIFATSLSLGSGGSGGVFAPSLFLGTMTGGFFGDLVYQYWPGVSGGAGAYALVGMGAVVAATTHAPITAIIIIFEMTNDYKIILPLMIATIIATLLSTKVQKESIYTLKLVKRGINLFRGREVNLLRSIKVSSVFNPDVLTIPPKMGLKSMLELLRTTKHNELHVIDKENRYLGTISMHEIKPLLGEDAEVANLIIAMDLLNRNIPTVNKTDSLDVVMKIFGKWEVEELPVIGNDNKIEGSISRHHAIESYNHELVNKNVNREVSSSIKYLDKMESIAISGGYNLAEIHPPASLLGKTIKESKIRQYFGVQIILIKRNEPHGEERQFSPGPDDELRLSDKLIVLGTAKQIQRIKTAG